MKIEIKKIALENYKCFKDERREFNFFLHTKISGANKVGKSTIQDLYYDVLTGKLAGGTKPDKIRPHDKNGVDINKVDCVRELVVENDGRLIEIKKVTSQKWRKPRGQMEEVFDGNKVDYEIDGFPYKPEKFNEYMSNIAKPDVILLCSNANVFFKTLQSSTGEARKLLEKLSGFSIKGFIFENPQYRNVQEITKGNSIEDTMKKLKKQLSEQKKKMEAQNTKIKYEKTRNSGKEKVNVSDLELAKRELKEKLAEIDKQEHALNESSKVYDELSGEIRDLKKKKDSIVSSANRGNEEKRYGFDWQIAELRRKQKILNDSLSQEETHLIKISRSIEKEVSELEKARDNYQKCSAMEFDESKLHEIESEQFDKNLLICPTCGQKFPEDKQDEMREQFLKSKERRIKEQEEARKIFNESVETQLESITLDGNTAKEELESLKKYKVEKEQEINQIKKSITDISLDMEKLREELDKVPASVDLSVNEEYMVVCRQIEEKEKELSSLNNGSEQRNKLREMRNNCMNELSGIDSRIQKINADEEEKERNLSKLESDLREISQAAADLEMKIDMVSEFSRAKNSALAEAINPHFHHFQFSFLEYTIEGNPVETCKMMCDGTDYMNGLNGGDRKLCEIDLCRGLQELNGLCLPIWVDEANTIDPYRIPKDLEQQLILISREDGELRVEEMA